ncbi:LysR substrate-binding domain-containing protein [Piscinibacter defluvii]|uniref:LysR substrate-binding domain-containing protein n=1 Tax=Piscinibacter defluvii TaxID=1796922 RepID=UPI000FDDEF60|nr:LysR substrate-binding domain-containing protein [Piscinibacter defluvii]
MAAPDVRFPSIDGLRAFEAAARLGSFERAADELNVTASAVGKRIAALEDLLGTPLFTRGAKPIVLTATGKEYLAQVGAALGLLAAVPLHQRAVQRSEKLRVSAPPTFARQILVPQLEAFGAAHPEIELEVVLSIPYLDVAPGEADVQVRHGDAAAHGGRVLMHDVVLPLAAPALLQRLAPLRTPADLDGAPLLRTPIEPWTPWFAAAGLVRPEPSGGPRLVDLGLTLEAAVAGQGIALARPSLARHWLETGTLVPVFRLTAVPAHQYYLLPHAPGSAAQRFADWLVATSESVAAQALALVSRGT